jgi:hypothetical protein
VVRAEQDFEKVGHCTVKDAIGEISCGTADEQSKACGVERAAALAPHQQPGEHANDGDGSHDQEDPSAGGSGIGQDAEGQAGIPAMDEIDKIVNEFVAPAFGGLRFEPGLGGAVEKNDSEREPEPAESC